MPQCLTLHRHAFTICMTVRALRRSQSATLIYAWSYMIYENGSANIFMSRFHQAKIKYVHMAEERLRVKLLSVPVVTIGGIMVVNAQ